MAVGTRERLIIGDSFSTQNCFRRPAPHPVMYPASGRGRAANRIAPARRMRVLPTAIPASAVARSQEEEGNEDGRHVRGARAAGVDVHKMEITATVRLCEGEGEPVVETRGFSTLPSGLDEMVAWLSDHGVEVAVMEGTGVYWQAPFEVLEEAGIKAILVHAQQVKQLKGRKTDVADSV